MPRVRVISATGTPASTWRKVVALCLSETRRFFLARPPGFEGCRVPDLSSVRWSRFVGGRQEDVIDYRINYLVKQRYTSKPISHTDVLHEKVKGERAINYILGRTLLRPLDAILFFNKCIARAADRPVITVSMVRDAEGEFSKDRLRALAEEWHADFPNFAEFATILKGRTPHVAIGELTDQECEQFCLEFTVQGTASQDFLSSMASQVVDMALSTKDFRKNLFQVFYRVGLVGLKLETYEKFSWVGTVMAVVSSAEITDRTRVAIHPAFWQVFGISEVKALRDHKGAR